MEMYESSNYSWWSASQPWIWLGLYLYVAICLYSVAQKLGHKYPWWSFIPILNIFQMVQLARKEWYWFLLMLIPFVNVVIYAWIWVDIAKYREKPAFWGIFMILPILNIVALLVLALGEQKRVGPKDYTEVEKTDYASADQR